MDLELSLIEFLCGKIDQHLEVNDLPTELRKDRHEVSAWLRELKRLGGVALVEDSEGGVPEIMQLTAKEHINVIRTRLQQARLGSSGLTLHIQNVGDNSTAIQGNANSITQSTGVELQAILDSFQSLISQVKETTDKSQPKEEVLRKLEPVQKDILNPQTSPQRILRWGKAAKHLFEAAATADGVLGLVDRLGAAVTLWQTIR